MFLASSSPKEPATPVILDSSYSQTIIDDRYVDDLCMYFYYVNYIAYKRSIFLLMTPQPKMKKNYQKRRPFGRRTNF